jgi:hypothetical protein
MSHTALNGNLVVVAREVHIFWLVVFRVHPRELRLDS